MGRHKVCSLIATAINNVGALTLIKDQLKDAKLFVIGVKAVIPSEAGLKTKLQATETRHYLRLQQSTFNVNFIIKLWLSSICRKSGDSSGSRQIRNTPDWSDNAVSGDHLWIPTSVSGDCCYVGDSDCTVSSLNLFSLVFPHVSNSNHSFVHKFQIQLTSIIYVMAQKKG